MVITLIIFRQIPAKAFDHICLLPYADNYKIHHIGGGLIIRIHHVIEFIVLLVYLTCQKFLTINAFSTSVFTTGSSRAPAKRQKNVLVMLAFS